MLFNILALISLLFVIAILKRFASILPLAAACMFRWKENVNIDTSLRLRTERDLTAAALLIPFCLLSARLRLYSPDFMAGMSDNAILGITAGVFVCYILMRSAMIAAVRPRKMASGIYHAATSTEHTFFILLTKSNTATANIYKNSRLAELHNFIKELSCILNSTGNKGIICKSSEDFFNISCDCGPCKLCILQQDQR